MPNESNVRQLTDHGAPIYPITDRSLVIGLQDNAFATYVMAWDGASTPVPANIPAGVVVNYNGTDYTGTLAASASTAQDLYLVASGSQPGEYDRYITTHVSSTYAWNALGSTAIVSPVIADDLVTNDSSKALSAKQGKILGDKTSELEADLTDLDVQLNGGATQYDYGSTLDALTHYSDGYQLKVPTAGTALSNVKKANGSNYRNVRVPVTGASRVEYYSNNSTSGYGSMFVDANDIVLSGHAKVSSESNPITLEVPQNAVYFIYSYTTANGSSNYCKVITDAKKIPTSKIEDEAVTTPKIADGAVTSEKLEDGAVQGAISGDIQEYIGFNLLDSSKSQVGYINKDTGAFVALSSGNVMATDFIPVNEVGIYSYCGDTYGSVGGCAVYDSNKAYRRNNGNSKDYTYQEGDSFVRFTYRSDTGYQVICYKPQDTITGAFNPTYDEQDITPFDGEQVFGADNIPIAKPAIASVGRDGVSTTIASLDGTSLVLDERVMVLTGFPKYIKNGETASARGKFSTTGEVRVGFGRTSINGYFVRLTSDKVYVSKFTGTDDNYSNITNANHGLSVSTFFDITFTMSFDKYKVIVMTLSGSFVLEGEWDTTGENYGRPFVEAVGTTVITDVVLRGVSANLRKPVWVVGDSYVSMYQQRWPYQMMKNFGFKDFLLDGLAGGASEGLFAELQKLFSLGCPKYLVWCLGMNDSSWNWRYYEKKVEMLCRANGVTLILQTIPYPESGTNKEVINNEVRASGYRYIDVFDAVSSNSDGDWYDGYCDDGVHPTILGAKAIAAQVLADFPEITQ